MPYIMNTLEDRVRTQAHGKWFTWNPGEIKILHNANLAVFLAQHRGEEGLAEVPDAIMDPSNCDHSMVPELFPISPPMLVV